MCRSIDRTMNSNTNNNIIIVIFISNIIISIITTTNNSHNLNVNVKISPTSVLLGCNKVFKVARQPLRVGAHISFLPLAF